MGVFGPIEMGQGQVNSFVAEVPLSQSVGGEKRFCSGVSPCSLSPLACGSPWGCWAVSSGQPGMSQGRTPPTARY